MEIKLIPIPRDIPTYMIKVKGHPAAEKYAEYVLPFWKKLGFTVNVMDAVVPETMDQQPFKLRFGFVKSNKWTQKHKIDKVFTETEKAVWYSHVNAWRKCVELNQPILIIEQDSIPIKPEHLWIPKIDGTLYNLVFKDRHSIGCYYITPDVAKRLVEYITRVEISVGPYGQCTIYAQSTKGVHIITDLMGPWNGDKWHGNWVTDQVYDPKFGATIDHYSNTAAAHLKEFYDQRTIQRLYQVDL